MKENSPEKKEKIEVEKKFSFDEESKKRLIDGAQLLSEKTFTDTYYDTDNFALTTCDVWLRERDGRWELKLPLNTGAERSTDQYVEINDLEKIKQKLVELGVTEYKIFCSCKTTRTKYQKGNFIIDLDAVDYGDFSYSIGEVELMVDNQLQIAEAEKRILEFIGASGLQDMPVRGKVIEFLRIKKPGHYQALISAGVIKE